MLVLYKPCCITLPCLASHRHPPPLPIPLTCIASPGLYVDSGSGVDFGCSTGCACCSASVCLPLPTSVRLPACPSLHLSVRLPAPPSICLSAFLPLPPSVCLSVCVCLSFRPSLFLSLPTKAFCPCLLVCLSSFFFFFFFYLYWENFRYIYGIPVSKTAQLKNDCKLTTLHIIILIR